MLRDNKTKQQFSHVAVRNITCNHRVQINNDMIAFQLHCHILRKYREVAEAACAVTTTTTTICEPLL